MVYAYLKDVCDRVVYSTTDKAIKEASRQGFIPNDKTPWGFISYHRDPTFNIDWDRDNYSMRITGARLKTLKTQEGKYTSVYSQAFPVNISYTVDLWAATNKRVQELGMALAAKLMLQDPVMMAPIEYNGSDARFHITSIEWVDNSDLEGEYEHGKIYRHSVSFTVAAHMQLVTYLSTRPFDYTSIPIEIYEGDDIDGEVCTECEIQNMENYRRDDTESEG